MTAERRFIPRDMISSDIPRVPERLMGRKIAFVFPGQGQQESGMGQGLYVTSPAAKAIFDKADQIAGECATLPDTITALCFQPDYKDIIGQTCITQPLVFTTSIAMLAAVKEKHPGLQPDVVAGNSLGEYAVLVASGALEFEDGLRLVLERARLMDASEPGAMAALIGVPLEKARELANRAKVYISNINTPSQVTISGREIDIERAKEIASEMKIRLKRLAISIGSHSPLMKPASDQLRSPVSITPFKDAAVPVIMNVDGKQTTSAEVLREGLLDSLHSTVLWSQSVETMRDADIDTFIEFGHGRGTLKLVADNFTEEEKRAFDIQTIHASELLQDA